MNVDSIRSFLHRQPFVPFTLRMLDGREIYLRHPDFVALDGRVVVVLTPKGGVSLLEPVQIASLELEGGESPPASTQTNGPPMG